MCMVEKSQGFLECVPPFTHEAAESFEGLAL